MLSSVQQHLLQSKHVKDRFLHLHVGGQPVTVITAMYIPRITQIISTQMIAANGNQHM